VVDNVSEDLVRAVRELKNVKLIAVLRPNTPADSKPREKGGSLDQERFLRR